MAKRANTDPLTGLLNRRSFEEQFNTAIRHRAGGIFIIADVDYLKALNDQYGHLIGDDAIISICHALSTVLGDECLIARMGGDEFCAYVPFGDLRKLDQLVADINAQARSEFQKRTGLAEYPLSITIGAQDCQSRDSFRDVIARSDGELYSRKRSRHGNIVAVGEI